MQIDHGPPHPTPTPSLVREDPSYPDLEAEALIPALRDAALASELVDAVAQLAIAIDRGEVPIPERLELESYEVICEALGLTREAARIRRWIGDAA